MKHLIGKQNIRALLAGAVLTITSAGVTAQSLESTASIGVSNLDYNGENNLVSIENDTDPGGLAQVMLAPMQFSGLNGAGSSDTLTWSGGAKAFVVVPFERPGLHVEAHASLLNTFYNVDNPPYFDATVNPPIIDPDGVPDNFYAYGKSGITEILSYGGFGASQYYARYIYRIHGHVSGDGFDSAYIVFQVGNNPLEFGMFEPNLPNGEVVAMYSTQRYPVANGMSPEQKSNLYVWYEADTQNVDEGSNITGAFDFSQTVTLDHIEVVDEDNNPVSGWTVTAATGLDYDLPIFRGDFDSPPLPAALAEKAITDNAVELCARLHRLQKVGNKVMRTSYCDQPIGTIREIKFHSVEASDANAGD